MRWKLSFCLVLLILSACENNSGGNAPLAGKPIDELEDSVGKQLTVEITVKNLPDTVNYNLAATPAGFAEYRWAVTFDINQDTVIGAGDLMFELAYRKETGIGQQLGSVLEFPATLRVFNTPEQTVQEMLVDVEKTGNTIKFLVELEDYPLLEDINDSTMVYFESSIYDASQMLTQYDYYPAFKTLAAISSEKTFMDSEDDTPFAIIDMTNMRVDY